MNCRFCGEPVIGSGSIHPDCRVLEGRWRHEEPERCRCGRLYLPSNGVVDHATGETVCGKCGGD